MQVVFVTVTSVYTKVCVVVARYSNAVPYFYGVLCVPPLPTHSCVPTTRGVLKR